MFGLNNQTTSNSLFGNNASGTMGTPTPGANNLQSSQEQKPTSLFGNAGSNALNNTSGNTAGGFFGSKPASTGGFFGNSNATAAQPATGGLFGNSNATATQPATGGLFGAKPATGGLFGNSTTTSTTGTTGASTGLFGNSASNNISSTGTTGGLFGNSSTSTAATNNTSTGLFGAAKPASTLGGGLFGNANAATSQPSGGLFGASNATSKQGGLFGNSNNNPSTNAPSGGLFGNSSSNITSSTISQSSNPYGFNINTNVMSAPIMKMPESITSSISKSKITSSNSDGGLINTNGDFRRLSSTSTPQQVHQVSQSLVDKLTSKLHKGPSIDSYQHSRDIGFNSHNKYEFLSKYHNSKSGTKNNQKLFHKTTSKEQNILSTRVTDPSNLRKLNIEPERIAAKKLKLLSGRANTTKSITPIHNKLDNEQTPEPENIDNGNTFNNIFSKPSKINDTSVTKETKENHSMATDYWCSPSIEQLSQMTVQSLSSVPNFVIGRKGYGHITYNYPVNLVDFKNDFKGLLFGKIVKFNSTKTVEVYPDESMKPEVGHGINVPATITLDNVYPTDKSTKKLITDISRTIEFQKFVGKLRKMSGMKFVSYNPHHGSWSFKVQHFSVWGLVGDEDSEDDAMEDVHIENGLLSTDKVNVDENMTHDFDDIDEDNDILDEKQYEPEVTEQDFVGLEINPNLETSELWTEQLKLAGKSLYSIYVSTDIKTESKLTGLNMLFSDFENDMEVEKIISKKFKFSPHNIGKFTNNSLLFIDQETKTIHTNSKSLRVKDRQLTSHIFEKLIHSLLVMNRESNGYPLVSKSSLKFSDLSEFFRSENQDSLIWDLCSILFDPIELPYEVDDEIAKSTLCKKWRFNSLCTWISNQVKFEISKKLTECSEELGRIFLYLAMNDVVNATKLAINSKNAHLAVLVTYFGSNNPQVKKFAKIQLEKWEAIGCNVDSNIVRIYKLLSDTLFEDRQTMNQIQNEFSVLAQLGLRLYYGQIDELSLEELISSSLDKIEFKDDIKNDILKIFSSQQTVDDLLEHSTLSSEFSDIENLWYFIEILKQSKNFQINDTVVEKTTLDMIESMRAADMITEPLIMSCFLKNDTIAKRQLDNIMFHDIAEITSKKFEFNDIFERLKLPTELKYEAISLYNRYNNDNVSEFENLIKAQKFKEAEKVFATIVAPKLIRGNSNDPNKLKSLLSTIDNSKIETWNQSFGVYELYLSLISTTHPPIEDIITLANRLSLYYQKYKSYREVSVSCNLMSQTLFSLFIKENKTDIDSNIKLKLLNLPVGEPEKAYLESVLK